MSAFTSTILITGGTTGLGYWAAYELARQCPDAKIIIASRSDKNHAADSLNKLLQKDRKPAAQSIQAQVVYLPLDLSSMADIRAFVGTHFSSNANPPIAKLLLNAGLQFYKGKEIRLTPDGIESTFAVNHVGHAFLFFLLKPYLAPTTRIVITASGTHDPAQKSGLPDPEYISAELLAHPTDKDGYEVNMRGLQRYATSKLTNVMFSYALERRLQTMRETPAPNSPNVNMTPKRNWTIATMDPGLMPGTSLGRDVGPVLFWVFVHVAPKLIWLMRWIVGPNVHTPQASGANLARLAMDTEPKVTESGKYFEGQRMIKSSVDSYDEVKQEDLWRWTVGFLAKDGKEKQLFETF
ncbi:hypothetical protein H2198_003033 [Neophaeococcomyces mojaviensis]|uniref:Uncharacterized protein n=1 Tax=Neophaeococcomyces mojaviensis TaxID=3383035 RepID=A0ACC3AD58_9EURO|nr:hypothetical protein H2198_003033 [Knufia sp. JES_112]